MRRPPLALLALACAHRPGAIEPTAWRELQSEHFRVRTDLGPTEARPTVRALEEVRAALVALGWGRNQGGLIAVLDLGERGEMSEYAAGGGEGCVTEDAFRDPIMVINGSQDPGEQPFLKHELAHV